MCDPYKSIYDIMREQMQEMAEMHSTSIASELLARLT